MSNAGLPAFDRTLQATHIWINEIEEALGGPDKRDAYRALRAVLHALRDRLPIEEVAHLGAQLPLLVRGLYYEGWRPVAARRDQRTADAFVEQVMAEFGPERGHEPEQIVHAVLAVLERHVSLGEIEDIKHVLPAKMRSVWPESV